MGMFLSVLAGVYLGGLLLAYELRSSGIVVTISGPELNAACNGYRLSNKKPAGGWTRLGKLENCIEKLMDATEIAPHATYQIPVEVFELLEIWLPRRP